MIPEDYTPSSVDRVAELERRHADLRAAYIELMIIAKTRGLWAHELARFEAVLG